MALKFGFVAHHRIVDVFGDLLKRFGLVVMGVDVDDQEIFVVARDRLLCGVAQQRARVEFFTGKVAEIAVCQVLHMVRIGQHQRTSLFPVMICRRHAA